MNRYSVRYLILAVFAVSGLSLPLLRGDEKPIIRQFRPPSAEELALKDNPAAPGSHAMILEWSVDRDDAAARESEYIRIKIFTEEGRKHADVAIPYSNRFHVSDVRARVIQPDGTIVPFTGKVFDKIVARTSSYQIKARTFTFPDVRVGSILEYHYQSGWDNRYLYTARWELQRSLFVRKARFAVKPFLRGIYFATYVTMGLTAEQQPKAMTDTYVLTLENLPAFVEERFSLPESQIKPSVSFYYTERGSDSAEQFWIRYAKATHKEAEAFIGNRNGISQAVSALVDAADTPETKLKKIYARSQQIRNLSYESTKSSQEQARVTPKENRHVEDVLKNGYGYRREINRLFIAMARAAGLDASVARVSQRDAQIFQREMLDTSQLDSEIAVVRMGDKDLLLDPATPFCPFGLLSWENTGVEALVITKDGGRFLKTPAPDAKDAVMRRHADLKLDGEGNLQGKVTVEFEGHYAMLRRIVALETDEAEQTKAYEKELENWLPQGSQVKLLTIAATTESDKPLRTEFSVEIPSITATAGARIMAPLLVFQARNSNPFEVTTRTHPIYFRHPYDDLDTVHITLPAELKVETIPPGTKLNHGFASYHTRWSRDGKTVSVTRREIMEGFIFSPVDYPRLRAFFRMMNGADKENAVLRAGE